MGVLWISCDRDDRRIFWGLKFSVSGFFWVGKFGQVFFWVFKTNVSIFRVISFNAFWKFLWLGNSAWDFSGLSFGSETIWGFCLKPKGVFRVMIFAPIRSSPSPEIHTYLAKIFCIFSPCFILINVAKAERGVIESRKRLVSCSIR